MAEHKHHYHRHFSGALYGILIFLALLLLGVFLLSGDGNFKIPDETMFGSVSL